MTGNFEEIRREYNKEGLSSKNIKVDPFEQFGVWMKEALEAEVPDATAMSLSTCSSEGKPSSRIVLLKGFSTNGFSFYTNYDSRKGIELNENPQASLLFFWPAPARQIRIEGTVSKVSEEDSNVYFAQRPRASRISAWISSQSRKIPDRKHLERLFHELDIRFKDKPIPRPPFWGGFLLKPTYFEFWQGRTSRLHDRISYSFTENKWVTQRLAP